MAGDGGMITRVRIPYRPVSFSKRVGWERCQYRRVDNRGKIRVCKCCAYERWTFSDGLERVFCPRDALIMERYFPDVADVIDSVA